MNLNCLETENVTLSLNYYNSLKAISSAFLDYIKQYHFISVEYHQKLLLLNTTYKRDIEDISNKILKKNIDFSQIFEFINTIPKLQDSYLESLLFFTEEISKQITIFEDKNEEQVISTCETLFNNYKKDFKNTQNELNDLKNMFFVEMQKTEIVAYEFYYMELKHEKKKENEYKISEAEMNMKILEAKDIENRYKAKIIESRNKEKKFVENCKFYSENIKKFANEIMEKLKKLILNFLMALKNNFKMPENEINSYLPKLIKLDKIIKLDDSIEKKFIHENIGKYLFNPEIYQMKILKKNKDKKSKNKDKENSIEIIDVIENKIEELEDGLEKIYLINDEVSLLTLKSFRNFELTNIDKKIDFIKENEKMKINQLSLKLFSCIKKESETKDNEPLNIEPNELVLLELLLEKHHNIIVFLLQLSKFRVSGNFYISKTIYSILSKFFNKILNIIKKEKDMFSAKNIIVLSQTYFMKDDGKKIYLQNAIQEHEVFKENAFWENLFDFLMSKEIHKAKNYMDKDILDKEGKNNYSKLAFGQIMTLANNMMDFGKDKDEIFEIIKPKIAYYELDEGDIYNIKCVLGMEND